MGHEVAVRRGKIGDVEALNVMEEVAAQVVLDMREVR